MGYFEVSDELQHHGIKGQKWGVRRFQTASGDLTAAGKSRYYGDSGSSYRASNGIKVGAPNSKGIERFRKFQGTKAGSATINAMSKLNTAVYGHGKNKERWEKMEERTRKENEAVREANQAHKEAVKAEKQAYKAEYKKNLQETRDRADLKEKFLYNDATRRRAAKLMTKYEGVTYEEATQQAHKEALRNTAVILGVYGAVTAASLYQINKN